MLNNCRAAALITQHKLDRGRRRSGRRSAVGAGSRIVAGRLRRADVPGAIALARGAGCAAHRRPHCPASTLDLAMLIYTSGSTGFPKGVMMTHANVVAAATSITTYLENTSDDVILNVLPISFDYGLYQVLMAMKLGATLVLEKSFAFPQAVFDKMRAERVTGFPLVPTMAALILQMKDLKPGAFPRPALHHQHRGGACRRRTSRGCGSCFPASASIRCTA